MERTQIKSMFEAEYQEYRNSCDWHTLGGDKLMGYTEWLEWRLDYERCARASNPSDVFAPVYQAYADASSSAEQKWGHMPLDFGDWLDSFMRQHVDMRNELVAIDSALTSAQLRKHTMVADVIRLIARMSSAEAIIVSIKGMLQGPVAAACLAVLEREKEARDKVRALCEVTTSLLEISKLAEVYLPGELREDPIRLRDTIARAEEVLKEGEGQS